MEDVMMLQPAHGIVPILLYFLKMHKFETKEKVLGRCPGEVASGAYIRPLVPIAKKLARKDGSGLERCTDPFP